MAPGAIVNLQSHKGGGLIFPRNSDAWPALSLPLLLTFSFSSAANKKPEDTHGSHGVAGCLALGRHDLYSGDERRSDS